MPQSRKPVPKSQKEISRSQQEPYVDPENGDTRGNPNEPSKFEQFTKTEQINYLLKMTLQNHLQ
jgi:hypothetical protein